MLKSLGWFLVGALLLLCGGYVVLDQEPEVRHEPVLVRAGEVRDLSSSQRSVEVVGSKPTSAGHVYYPAWFGMGWTAGYVPVFDESEPHEPEPGEIRVVVGVHNVSDEREFSSVVGSKRLKGLVVPLESRPRVARSLQKLYPGINVPECQLVEVSDRSAMTGSLARFVSLSIAVLGLIICLVPTIKYIHRHLPNVTPSLPGAEIRQQAHLKQLALINHDES